MPSEPQEPGTERSSTLVDHHLPLRHGSCDDCNEGQGPSRGITGRATHKMADGSDVCGYHYGVRMGYYPADENRGETA